MCFHCAVNAQLIAKFVGYAQFIGYFCLCTKEGA